MVHYIKYGDDYLRRGGIGGTGTVYLHPSQIKKAAAAFEKRHPMWAGKGKVVSISRGKIAKVTDVCLF